MTFFLPNCVALPPKKLKNMVQVKEYYDYSLKKIIFPDLQGDQSNMAQ